MAKNYTASLSNVLFASNSCHDAGALAVWGVSHTIGPNATFFNNLAFKSGSIAGAVYIRGETDEAIIGSVPFQSNMTGANFTGNGARSQGGAVFYRGIWTPRVVDSVFESNTVSTLATTDGSNTAGAVFMNELELSPAFFERVVFRANRAFVAGAMLVVQSNLSMVDCWFDDNTAMESAGGLSWTQPITSPLYYQVNISGSNFTRNAATGYIGGAVRIQMAGAVIRGCLFEDNWAGGPGIGAR
ncbi:hypothetical protein FOA52_008172 [Chlamydomonas sp. UWO 241]|nr:hypothetical protein FOA52_008172 [Chlamydomonas sp. UWO 241]